MEDTDGQIAVEVTEGLSDQEHISTEKNAFYATNKSTKYSNGQETILMTENSNPTGEIPLEVTDSGTGQVPLEVTEHPNQEDSTIVMEYTDSQIAMEVTMELNDEKPILVSEN